MPSSQKSNFSSAKAHAAVIISGCMWGSCGIFVRVLDGYGYSALTIVFVRMSVAFFILLPILFLYKKPLLRIKLKDIWIFIGTALTSAIFLNLFYSMSIVMNSLSLAAVLLSTDPIFVVFISAFLFKEKITSLKLTSLVTAFVGCVLTSGLIGSALTFNPVGVLVGILAAVGFAFYGIFSRLALNRGYNAFTVNIYSFGIGALACIPFTNFSAVSASLNAEPVSMGFFLIAHAVFTSLLPYVLFTYGLNFMDTGKASILESVEPVAATLFGIVLFSETPTVISVIGMILVIFAVALLQLPQGFKLGASDKDG